MPLTAEDLNKIRAHLGRFPNQGACPVCHERSWEASGPYVLVGTDDFGNIVIGGPTMPLIVLICRTCLHARQFAWLPIKRLPAGDLPLSDVEQRIRNYWDPSGTGGSGG